MAKQKCKILSNKWRSSKQKKDTVQLCEQKKQMENGIVWKEAHESKTYSITIYT